VTSYAFFSKHLRRRGVESLLRQRSGSASTRLLVPAGIVLGAGLIVLSSVSRHLFFLQLIWAALGIAVVALFMRVDWHLILNYRWVIWGLYSVGVILLAVTFGVAPIIRNTRSWLVFGPLTFQPVELVKIALILAYARYFSRRHLSVARWGTVLGSFALFAVPAILVALQPDLGSALVLFGVWFGFLLVSGLPRRRILAALVAFLLLGAVGWRFVLRDYQRERILGVIYPEQNALTVNYSVIQSKIAIGSAGWWGKGYGQGPQTQLGFLSEPANDFILAALIEEWGLVAGLAVIGAFIVLLFRILQVGLVANQNFERFLCLGVAMVFGFHFIMNAGSAAGIFPVIGVTFPFLSYGGSSLVTDSFLLAIVNAIARRS